MAHTISNSDDLIDSRDVIARIEELDEERAALADAVEEARAALDSTPADTTDDEAAGAMIAATYALTAWDEDRDAGGELKALKALADEAAGYCSEWKHGETLIRESYFKEYAQDLAEDCDMIKPELSGQWPYTCIDWDMAARELRLDYTSIEYDGVTYWAR